MFRVTVDGPFGLSNSEGQDCTPRGKKTRGLLLLLIHSNEFRRSRAWLQDKLWSDRGPDQAAASLRQALTELRRCLGPERHRVITANGCIQLDPSCFELVAFHGSDPSSFCEDLDINDREFEDWLREQRQSLGGAVKVPSGRSGSKRPTVVIGLQEGSKQFHGHLLKDEVIRNLLELSDLRIFDLNEDDFALPEGVGPSVFVRINVSSFSSNTVVSAKIETIGAGLTVWQSATEVFQQDSPADDENIWRLRTLGQTLVAQIMDELERQAAKDYGQLTAQALFNRAYHTIFGFRRQDLMEADKLLKAAYALEPRGSYLSWRAFVRNTAMFEHLSCEFLEPCDMNELHEVALRSDPMNSHSLVFAAQHSFVNDGDAHFGMTLVDKALERNPSNALGWGFRSNMLILQGRNEEAREAAHLGMQLADGQPVISTMSIFSCMAEIANQELEQAIVSARYGVMASSNCQALRRFLFALFKALEMPSNANKQMELIRSREPDFTEARLADRTYPMRTMHHLPIMDRFAN